MIKLENLSKSYEEAGKKHNILQSINTEIKDGEVIILLGRSGSGKSTLLNLLSGIDTPDKGRIMIAGQDITALKEKDRTLFRRNRIGFVFQFFNLIPTLTVQENLLLPLELKDETGRSAEKKVNDFLDQVDLTGRENTYPDRLSGGEQQRVAIARALIHDPEIILADEPTGNLDFETGAMIIDIFEKLIRDKGKTMIMATHSREISKIADRVISIKDGKMIEINKGDL